MTLTDAISKAAPSIPFAGLEIGPDDFLVCYSPEYARAVTGAFAPQNIISVHGLPWLRGRRPRRIYRYRHLGVSRAAWALLGHLERLHGEGTELYRILADGSVVRA